MQAQTRPTGMKRSYSRPRPTRRTTYRPLLEVLEDRTLPSVSLAGTIFNDLNSNLARDPGESGLPAIVAYLDLNHNGALDGATSSFTGSNTLTAGKLGLVNSNANATVSVSGLPTSVSHVNVSLNISNSKNTNVIVGLASATGKNISGGLDSFLFNGSNLLVLGQGSFNGALDDQAATRITDTVAGGFVHGSVSGTFGPDQSFTSIQSHIYDGDPNGVWGLVFFGDTSGITVSSWSISFMVPEPTATTDATGAYAFSNLGAGSYSIGVVLPSGGSVTAPAGGFQQVNLGAGQTITGLDFGVHAAPDLAGASFAIPALPTDWNQDVTIQYSIANQGLGNAAGFNAEIRLSSDGTFGAGDILLATVPLGPLAAQTTTGLKSITVHLPTAPAGFGAVGLAFLGLRVDPSNSISEANEANNSGMGVGLDLAPLGAQANVDVTSSAGVQQMPSIAIDPTNQNHVVTAYMDYSALATGYAGIAVANSTDGGKTWTKTTLPLPANFDEAAGNPIAHFDASGRVYVEFMAARFLGPVKPGIIYDTAALSSLANITLGAGGSYATAPTVVFSGGGSGSGAAATAVINGSGAVIAINITSVGSGYTSAPTISFTGGGGSGATATATITTASKRSLGSQANNGIFMVSSADGVNWSAPTAISSQLYTGPSNTLTTNLKVPFDTLPDFAVDTSSGTLYATWTRFYPAGIWPGSATLAGTDIMVAVSTDHGQTWSIRNNGFTAKGYPITTLLDPFSGLRASTAGDGGGNSTLSHVAVGPQGDIYISMFAGGLVSVSHSTNGGQTFTVPDQNSIHGYPFGGSTSANTASATMANNTFRTLAQRSIVADPAHPGRVYIVESMFVRNAAKTATIDTGEINFARSDDYGATWTWTFQTGFNPSNLSELSGAQTNDFRSAVNDDDGGRYLRFDSNLTDDVISSQALPRMAIDANGNIAIVWLDSRRDPAGHLVDVYGAISTDGGLSFSPNFRVSDTSFDATAGTFKDRNNVNTTYLGDAIGLSFVNGIAYAAWTDTRSGNQDVIVSRLALPPGPAVLDDQFEPNNTAATAVDFGNVTAQRLVPRLSLTASDEDWYKVKAGATGQLLAAATGAANLSVELWSADGSTRLDTGANILDAGGKVIGQQINHAATSGDVFLVRVRSTDGGVANYSLVLRSLTADLGARVHGLQSKNLVANTQDVYSLTAPLAGSLELTLSSAVSSITLTVLTSDGLTTLGSGKTLSLAVSAGQTVLLQVSGTASGAYSLEFTNLDQFETARNAGLLFSAPGFPASVVVGDLNNDGAPDVVSSSNQNADVVNVFLGNLDGAGKPNGTLQTPRSFAIGAGLNSAAAREVKLVDVDNDGVLDIAVTNNNSADVSVLLGLGDGTFQPERRFDATPLPDALAVGDFNGDGFKDLVVLERFSGQASVGILYGNGDGTFKPPVLLPLAFDSPTFPVRVADLGNGHDDLLVFCTNVAKFQVFMNDGHGGFTDGGQFAAGEITLDAQLADINRDGKTDIVTAGANTGAIFLILGNGDGTFQAPQSTIASPPRPSDNTSVVGLVIGDFGSSTGLGAPDGQLDIVVTAKSRSGATPPQVIYLGGTKGTGGAFTGFAAPKVLANVGSAGKLASGDFDGDGKLDIVVADAGGLRLLFASKPTITANTTLAAARDLGAVAHAISQPIAVVPGFVDQYFKLTVPVESSPAAGKQVLDFSALFQNVEAPGIDMEVLDANGVKLDSGSRFRVVADQGATLYIHIFGLGTTTRGAGVVTFDVDVLPQVIAAEGVALVPGGPVASIVLTLQGDRLDPAAAQSVQNPANYVVRFLGADNLPNTADDQLLTVGAATYNAGANIEVSSGRTFPTAVRQTVTLLFASPLQDGSYQIELKPAITTANVFANEANVLAPRSGFNGHPVVHVDGGVVEGGIVHVGIISGATDPAALAAYANGTPFLTQMHADLGAQLDRLLNKLGDDPTITGSITAEILARMLPGYAADGTISYLVIWLDPVSIDLADPSGNRAVFDQQTNLVSNNLARTFIEVGGNVQLLVMAAAAGSFTLNVGDVPATARGGAVLLTPGQVQTVALTDAIRGSERSFTFNFDSSTGSDGSGTLTASVFSGSTALIPGLNAISLTLPALTALTETALFTTATIDGAFGVGGQASFVSFFETVQETIGDIVAAFHGSVITESFVFGPDGIRSLTFGFSIPLDALGLDVFPFPMMGGVEGLDKILDAGAKAGAAIVEQIRARLPGWIRGAVVVPPAAAPMAPMPEEQEELQAEESDRFLATGNVAARRYRHRQRRCRFHGGRRRLLRLAHPRRRRRAPPPGGRPA
ncbi:MAG: FG-GAP-like repeat-containing protein [Gemmataceae bacterium]